MTEKEFKQRIDDDIIWARIVIGFFIFMVILFVIVIINAPSPTD